MKKTWISIRIYSCALLLGTDRHIVHLHLAHLVGITPVATNYWGGLNLSEFLAIMII